jgi:hypothetical protein
MTFRAVTYCSRYNFEADFRFSEYSFPCKFCNLRSSPNLRELGTFSMRFCGYSLFQKFVSIAAVLFVKFFRCRKSLILCERNVYVFNRRVVYFSTKFRVEIRCHWVSSDHRPRNTRHVDVAFELTCPGSVPVGGRTD